MKTPSTLSTAALLPDIPLLDTPLAGIESDPLGLSPLPADNRQRFLRFFLSQKNNTLIPLSQVLEVMPVKIEDIFPVPDMPNCVLGVCSWQGETLWLVDLNHLVGYTPLFQRAVATPVVIVVQAGDESLGLVVEKVDDIDLFDEADVYRETGLCPPGLEPFVSGYLPNKGGTVLDVAAIVRLPRWRAHV